MIFNMTRLQKNKKQQEYRLKNNYFHTKKYEKTINGFLMRAYRNMYSRVTGGQKNKNHIYLGLDILSKEEFYNYSRNNKDFLKLFKHWKEEGYPRKLAPSVNRINSNKGYSLDNIEWITQSLNSSLSAVTRNKKIYKIVKKILEVKND